MRASTATGINFGQTYFLCERKASRADHGLPLSVDELQLDLRFHLSQERGDDGTSHELRRMHQRAVRNPCDLFIGSASFTSGMPKTFGSLMNAWPDLQLGGISPVHDILRHSIIVCLHSAQMSSLSRKVRSDEDSVHAYRLAAAILPDYPVRAKWVRNG